MDLFPFQEAASTQIANRFQAYAVDPLMIDRTRTVPFFQMLVALTGSGKTLILADTVSELRARLPRQPIVLWLSKGRVVVWQTYENLAFGRYASNIPGFVVKPLAEAGPGDIEDEKDALLLVATVGKFARQDDQEGDRRIFQVDLDSASESLWSLLKQRRTPSGERRPLIVVYDEGQNLSDLQTSRLLELSPDALISASATPTVPEAMTRVMDRLRTDKGWEDSDFKTVVSSLDVVRSGLVKQAISLGGYITPMETAIDALLEDFKAAGTAASLIDDPFRPKAMYVCTTNAVDGAPIAEDVRRPFEERQARPIVIWRHLVASGIDPSKIAVYCQLKFNSDAPPPRSFNLFGAGDRDFDRFNTGQFEHVIFNLSLQEGWDDPRCGFAYIDKEMASTRQVTQVIGRALRQPGAKHHQDNLLNTAHFYIRADEQGVFDQIISEIRDQIANEHPSIELSVRAAGAGAASYREPPTREKEVPTTSIYSGEAKSAVKAVIDGLMDFRSGGPNVVGQGARMQILQEIGVGGATQFEWVEVEHSNRVTVRSVFRRELQRLFPGGLRRAGGPTNLVDIELPKFDALIEVASPAADHVRDIASQTVDRFIEYSRILQNDDDPAYRVGPVAVTEGNVDAFNNAIHSRYSGLNGFERDFARELDRTQRVWCRNPAGSGYFIPLLDRGATATFWPDFLVWTDRKVVAIDTKGSHLISEDARRKLFQIEGTSGKSRIQIRLISQGEWHVTPGGQLTRRNNDGYTVWVFENGQLKARHSANMRSAVETSLLP